MEAPIRQECLVVPQNEPRTPYQQQIQAAILSTHSAGVGRGATLELMWKKSEELECQATTVGHGQGLSTKNKGAIPKKYKEAPGQNPQGPSHGRSRSCLQRGRGSQQRQQSQSALCKGGGATASTCATTPAVAVQLGFFCPRHPADFRGEGWKKDAHQAYLWHISITIDVTAEEADTLTTPVTRHMEQNRCKWHFVKEDDPLWYWVLLNDFFKEVHGYCLNNLDHYTEWIKPRGWCHKVILQREQLNYCKHLTGVEPPPEDVERPSELTLHSHRAAYEAAKWNRPGKLIKKARATLMETLMLHRLEEEYYYILGGEKGDPPKVPEAVPMEVCSEAAELQAMEVETHLRAVNTSLRMNRSEMRKSELQRRHLKGDCLHLPCKAQLPPSLQPLPLMKTDSHQFRDRSLDTRGPGTPQWTLLEDGDPPRPPGHLSLSH